MTTMATRWASEGRVLQVPCWDPEAWKGFSPWCVITAADWGA